MYAWNALARGWGVGVKLILKHLSFLDLRIDRAERSELDAEFWSTYLPQKYMIDNRQVSSVHK